MRHANNHNSPEARQRAHALVRFLTRASIVGAAGATALIGFVVAKEHPGASSAASTTTGTVSYTHLDVYKRQGPAGRPRLSVPQRPMSVYGPGIR